MILFGLLTGRDSHFPFIFLPVLHTKMDSGQQRQLIQCFLDIFRDYEKKSVNNNLL